MSIQQNHSNGDTPLSQDERYPSAKRFLDSLLAGEKPLDNTIAHIYGTRQSVSIVIEGIYDFFQTHNTDEWKVRSHDNNAPFEISSAISGIEYNSLYRSVNRLLLKGVVPEIAILESFCGRHAGYVHKNYEAFLTGGIMREANIPYVVHVNDMAFSARELFGQNMSCNELLSEKIINAVTAALMHDTPELLLKDLLNYESFMNEMIPAELQPTVQVLTNHYHMILNAEKEHFRNIHVHPSKQQLKEHLQTFMDAPGYNSLKSYIYNLIQFLDSNDFGLDIFNETKLLVYDLYMNDSFVFSRSINDYTGTELKSIDLSLNSDSQALGLNRRIATVLKRQSYCNEAFRRSNLPVHVVLHARELQEQALIDAEHIVLKGILSKGKIQQNLRSALECMAMLYPTFFENYTPNKPFN